MGSIEPIRARIAEGLVIPACPLALNARRELDEAKSQVIEARNRLRDRIDVLARELALKTEKLGEKMRSAKSDLKKKLAMEKDHMEKAGRRQNEKLRELLETAV